MKCLAVRSREPPPPAPESYVSVKKIRTKEKEKEQMWLWDRPSRTSSISTVSSPTSSPFRHKSQHRRVQSKHRVYESTRSEDEEVGEKSHHRRRRRRHEHKRQTSEHHTHLHHHHYHHILPVHSPPTKHHRALPAPSPPPKHHRCKPAAVLDPEENLQELPIPLRKSRRSSRNMDEIDIFTYKRERACVATESVAPSTVPASSVASSNGDNTYHYVAMREPGAQDAVPIAYGYAPFYAYHQQPIAVAAPKSVKSVKSAKSASAPPPCHCDDESANYITDKVVEKRSKSVVRAASPPPPSEPKMPYAIYPAAAHPIAYAMPNYPIPVHPAREKSKDQDKEDGKRVWVGRTKKQVDEDNAKIANKEGVYKPNDIMPKGAAPDQLFWVIEQDGTNTLRTFRTIEEDLQPGKWKIDPRYGNVYFVRKDKK